MEASPSKADIAALSAALWIDARFGLIPLRPFAMLRIVFQLSNPPVQAFWLYTVY